MNNLKKSKFIRFKKEEIHQIMELYSKKNLYWGVERLFD